MRHSEQQHRTRYLLVWPEEEDKGPAWVRSVLIGSIYKLLLNQSTMKIHINFLVHSTATALGSEKTIER